jgi:hypothetical protein
LSEKATPSAQEYLSFLAVSLFYAALLERASLRNSWKSPRQADAARLSEEEEKSIFKIKLFTFEEPRSGTLRAVAIKFCTGPGAKNRKVAPCPPASLIS